MNIALLTHTPEPLRVLWTAARTCYADESAASIWFNEAGDERMLKTVRGCIVRGHNSVIRHVSFTFAIDSISRACANQLTRHGPGWAFDQQSLRYVALTTEPAWVIPDHIDTTQAASIRFGATTAYGQYLHAIELGAKPEDARGCLPLCTPTNLVATANLAAFLHFWNVRRLDATGKAQTEIKTLADQMGRLIVAAEPWLGEFISAVPA